jgi:hypothetical protein
VIYIYIYIVGHHRVSRNFFTTSRKNIVENLVVHVKKIIQKKLVKIILTKKFDQA